MDFRIGISAGYGTQVVADNLLQADAVFVRINVATHHGERLKP